MSCPACRPWAVAALGLLSRGVRPAAGVTGAEGVAGAATRQTAPLRSLHQAHGNRESSLAAPQAPFISHTRAIPTVPTTPISRPRPRRSGHSAGRRSFHATAPQESITERLGDMARQAMRRTVEPYGAFGVTKQLYQKCSRQAAYEISEEARRNDLIATTEDGEEIGTGGGIWHDDFDLLPSFSTWSQVTMLHMYLVVTRLRCFDRETCQLWQSMLTDHFFQEAEDKMDRVHHITSRALRQRHLQDLFMTWRGVIVAYDEGLVRSDAILAAALWRNIFKARADMDLRTLAAVVAWMRHSFAALDRLPDEKFILHGSSSGVFDWPSPVALLPTVDAPASKELATMLQEYRQELPEEAAAKHEQTAIA